MAEGGGGDRERISISDAVKSHKKYGSIMNNAKKHEFLIKHVVNPGETLQGIALRYGVTMEQIRRANKIWTNDSLFLRETLLIPVPNSNKELYTLANSNGDELMNVVIEATTSSAGQENNVHATSAGDRLKEGQGSECDKSNQTIADILIRIDSSIALTRNQVEQREKLHDQQSPDDGLPRVKHRPHQHQSRMRQSLQSPTSPDNVPGNGDSRPTHQPVAMAQGKRVQSSLQRLQQQQDEMFEL